MKTLFIALAVLLLFTAFVMAGEGPAPGMAGQQAETTGDPGQCRLSPSEALAAHIAELMYLREKGLASPAFGASPTEKSSDANAEAEPRHGQ